MGLMDAKTCIVTGGAGSLGLASAAAFVREGGRVMLVDLKEEDLARAKASLAAGDRVATFAGDVADATTVRAFVAATVAAFGKIDVIFANAGINGMMRPIADYPEDVFDRVIAVNIRGPFLAMKYGFPEMKDGGSFIVTSSVAGVTADPGISAYATSKHGVIGLVRTAAKEMAGRRIRVNALCPGPIDNAFQLDIEKRLTQVLGTDATEFLNGRIPLGRHGTAEEVANTVLFLASDLSTFSTGSVYSVDGGMNI